MDAVEFFEEHDRMCNSFGGNCTDCEIYKVTMSSLTCNAFIFTRPREMVAIVERWAKEHPRKTRQSEFLKMFPDAQIFEGVLKIEPCELIDSKLNSEECHSYDEFGLSGCYECRKKYWLEEVE